MSKAIPQAQNVSRLRENNERLTRGQRSRNDVRFKTYMLQPPLPGISLPISVARTPELKNTPPVGCWFGSSGSNGTRFKRASRMLKFGSEVTLVYEYQ